MSAEVTLYDRSVDFAIQAWLHEKKNRSGSERTYRTYAHTIQAYRGALAGVGLDLDSDTRRLGLVLQSFAGGTIRGMEVSEASAATYNLRRSVVSSFYQYCRRHELLGSPDNPAERVEPRPTQSYRNATPISPEILRQRLLEIDRDSLAGKRDYALLVVALTTGRRLNEIAQLTWNSHEHDAWESRLVFRAKGGKVMRDKLSLPVREALFYWTKAYDKLPIAIPNDEPIPLWISLARNKSYGKQLSVQAIEDICERRLGTSRFHALRHSFAHMMEEAGAKTSEIQSRLGHSNIATTGIYLAALRSDENKYAEDLTRLLGI